MQEVQLDQKIKLLDSPGVVLASSGDTADVLKNATKVEHLVDPIAAATTILMRATKQQVEFILHKIFLSCSSHYL